MRNGTLLLSHASTAAQGMQTARVGKLPGAPGTHLIHVVARLVQALKESNRVIVHAGGRRRAAQAAGVEDERDVDLAVGQDEPGARGARNVLDQSWPEAAKVPV